MLFSALLRLRSLGMGRLDKLLYRLRWRHILAGSASHGPLGGRRAELYRCAERSASVQHRSLQRLTDRRADDATDPDAVDWDIDVRRNAPAQEYCCLLLS